MLIFRLILFFDFNNTDYHFHYSLAILKDDIKIVIIYQN